MRLLYFLLFAITCIFSGCSSKYTIQDFSSKEKFYTVFNEFANTKNVTVTLTNDSSFVVESGVLLLRDTLFNREIVKRISLPVSEISKIITSGTDEKSGSLLLKNGEMMNVNNIIVIPDSISFSLNSPFSEWNSIAPISKVKTVNYKKKWFTMIIGIIAGIPVGLDIRYNIHNDTFPLKHGNFWGDFVEGLSPFLIPVIGGTVGYFIGYNYSYQFNP